MPPLEMADIERALDGIARQMTDMLEAPLVERVHDGIRVVIAGPPNSGKSTLLNAMADRDAAIVSPISGTTRDRIEAMVARDGVAYVLTDTAGLVDHTDDPIERIGVGRAKQAIDDADILIWLGDDAPPPGALWLHARADQPGRRALPSGPILAISAGTGDGLPQLWALLSDRAAALLPPPDIVALNRRHHALLSDAVAALAPADGNGDPIVIAERIRIALRSLHLVTGRGDVESMLDTLFGRFCIGK